MKINVFNTQCRIGSRVKLRGKSYTVKDINRQTHEVCLWKSTAWIRCTEVELLNQKP